MNLVKTPIPFPSPKKRIIDVRRAGFIDRYLDFAMDSAERFADLQLAHGEPIHELVETARSVHQSVGQLLSHVEDKHQRAHLHRKLEQLTATFDQMFVQQAC